MLRAQVGLLGVLAATTATVVADKAYVGVTRPTWDPARALTPGSNPRGGVLRRSRTATPTICCRSLRMPVEHAVGRMKWWRALRYWRGPASNASGPPAKPSPPSPASPDGTTAPSHTDATRPLSVRGSSLLGIGGSGKTRLAQAVAASLIDQFPDGVWFVDLVPVASADAIPAAIATAAGFDLGTVAQTDALLRSRRPLTSKPPRSCSVRPHHGPCPGSWIAASSCATPPTTPTGCWRP